MPSSSGKALPDTLRQLLDQAAKLAALQRSQGFEFTPIGMRENLDLMTRRFVTEVVEIPLVRDILVRRNTGSSPPVPVRIYHPRPDDQLPVLVFSHGGGHMAGSVSVYDRIARKLAAASQHLLVSVDYRLAPECPYPMGLTDLKDVMRGIFADLERCNIGHERRLAVAGDSGGAAITASAVHELGGEPPVDSQVLVYPSLDYTMSTASMETLGKGYLLERERVAWLFDQYLRQGEDRKKVSPLFMPLPASYPRTLVVTAAYCPLRDEGIQYVERLQKAGHDAEHLDFDNMIHAFLNLEDLVPDACADFYQAAGRFLQAQQRRARSC